MRGRRAAGAGRLAAGVLVACVAVGVMVWAAALAGCGGGEGAAGDDVDEGANEAEVVVETETPEQWAQYQANLRFALDYVPTCSSASQRPRVLVTGYGRFMSHARNATGLIVERLVPDAIYPLTMPPPPGEVDDPAPQTSVALSTLDVPGVGEVDVCAMILPVSWDLAAALVLREVQAFGPQLVVMNGIAGPRQPVWLELGSVNRAMGAPDGSSVLAPKEGVPLVSTASPVDHLRPLLMSWGPVKQAAIEAAQAEGDGVDDEGVRFGDVLTGALFGGYPRPSNTYLCNNVAYTVGYLMGYPGKKVTLLKASKPRPGQPSGISLKLTRDHRATPRVFVHWPSELSGDNLGAAARVLAAIIGAQLRASAEGDLPTPGDNAFADLLPSGDTY